MSKAGTKCKVIESGDPIVSPKQPMAKSESATKQAAAEPRGDGAALNSQKRKREMVALTRVNVGSTHRKINAGLINQRGRPQSADRTIR